MPNMAMARLSVDDLKGFFKRLEGGEYREFAQQLRRSVDLFLRIERMPKPVIAAVNGVAIAGGLEFMLRHGDRSGHSPHRRWAS